MTRTRLAVAVVWLAFVIRGAYYSVQLPMWEGLDEWAHFAALEYFAQHGHMPSHVAPVSDAVMRSLELAPLAWSNNGWIAGSVNHDEFWQLPAEDRGRRIEELNRITGRFRRPASLPPATQAQYEGQQAPLYHALMTPLYWAVRDWTIERQVIWLRIWGVLFASACIPLAWGIARRIGGARVAAIGVAALVAAMPAVPLYAAHVGNDALAMALMTASLWVMLHPRVHWLAAGTILGAALLTKGYALILLPLFFAAGLRQRKLWGAAVLGIALSGWWYAGNLVNTGSLTGDQLNRNASAGKAAALTKVDWGRVVDSGLINHLWIGGWSFLQVRSWMYRVWEAIGILGVMGLLLLARRPDRNTAILISAVALFGLAVLYFALNTYLAVGLSTGIAWYVLTIFGIEATLLACGFTGLFGVAGSRYAIAATVVLALAFDLYTVHFLLAPYYGGLIRHRANGSLEAYHWHGLPPVPRIWGLYLLANAALAYSAIASSLPSRRPRT